MRYVVSAAAVAVLVACAAVWAWNPAEAREPSAQAPSSEAEAAVYRLEAPRVALSGVPFAVTVRTEGFMAPRREDMVAVAGGRRHVLESQPDGSYRASGLRLSGTTGGDVKVAGREGSIAAATVRVIPGWVSILPALVAILVALVSKQVLPSLFLGIWLGATVAAGFGPRAALQGVLDAYNVHVLGAVADPDHAAILLFTVMIGGMVGLITRNGGMHGVADLIVRRASTSRRGQLATSFLGVAVFFDDVSNPLIVGNTMRGVSDRLRISREKLSYIVDATSSPVACVALVSTWIGFQVGLLDAALSQVEGSAMSAYALFVDLIPYNFYPLLTMVFLFAIALSGRDFGPMRLAEVRARTTGAIVAADAQLGIAGEDVDEIVPVEGKARRAVNGVVPILVLAGTMMTGLYVTGEGSGLREIIGSADSYAALMWGSILGVIVAVAMTLAQRILSLEECVGAWYLGIRSMLYPTIILVLAWSLSSVAATLHTADYLVGVLGDTLLPAFVPALTFVLAGLTSFATGSSWGTMGILMPLILPLTWAVLESSGVAPESSSVLLSSLACVIGGAVFGDHCSPISDTTILSSLTSGSDHIAHVRTQMPYAVVVAVVTLVSGALATGLGAPWWAGLLAGTALLLAIVRWWGRPVGDFRAESEGLDAMA